MNATRLLVAFGLLLVLLVANQVIQSHERTLREGDMVLVALAPVDPRSLMQGDYMALNFALAATIQGAQGGDVRDGYAIVKLDPDRVAQFQRQQPAAQPRAADEIAIRFRSRERGVRIATNAYFFQEGTGERYARARFGELRVADDGTALLVGLREVPGTPL